MAGDVMVGEFKARSPMGRRAGRVHRLGEAEVEDLHGAVGADLDVRGFEIAVDDPLLVGGLEGLGDLPGRWAGRPTAPSARLR